VFLRDLTNTKLTFTFNSCTTYDSVNDGAKVKGSFTYVVAQGQGTNGKSITIDPIDYTLTK
jgi:hypothetical protein